MGRESWLIMVAATRHDPLWACPISPLSTTCLAEQLFSFILLATFSSSESPLATPRQRNKLSASFTGLYLSFRLFAAQ
jgi:hypothetical protein